MSNGGIIEPVNDPTRGDLTTTFTSSGTYTSPGFGPGQADYLVVAGGGGEGSGIVIVKQTAAGPVSIASGVWSLQEQYNFKKNNQWTS